MKDEEKTNEILAKSSVDFVTGKRLIPNEPNEKCSELSSSQVSYIIRNACLEMAKWKERQMIEKTFAAMREIYESYGYIPENCKEEFEQIIRRNHE